MSESRTRKVYGESFKRTIVNLYNGDKDITDLSSRFSASPLCIHKWMF